MDEKTNKKIIIKISEEMIIRCLRFISNSEQQDFSFFEFGDIRFELGDVDNESFNTKFKIDENHYNETINKIDDCIKVCQEEKIKEYLKNLKNRFESKNNSMQDKKNLENLINTIDDKEIITEILNILNKKSLSQEEKVIEKILNLLQSNKKDLSEKERKIREYFLSLLKKEDLNNKNLISKLKDKIRINND